MDRKRRIFFYVFKKEKVSEIESGVLTIAELFRLYSVSRTSIYKWLYRYGNQSKKGVRMVVEKESEATRTAEALGKVSELERLLGQKQVEIEYLNRVIAEGDNHYQCDLKKSFGQRY
jgi:transposase-like protein